MRILYPLLTLLWMGVVIIGLSKLWKYESTPAPVEASSSQWPVSSRLSEPHGIPVLLMFAHPHCPCTRATLSELARNMAHNTRPIIAYVLFYKPKDTPDDWAKTDLYDRARAIPGVTALYDEDGSEAQRFHATTSGLILLFDGKGRILFRGGITAARGHEGDNEGQESLLSLLNGKQEKQFRFPVFGCSLTHPN